MWEGVVRKCDVCCDHPRNPPKGDEIKTRLGESREQPPPLTVHHFLPVSTVGFFKTAVHS